MTTYQNNHYTGERALFRLADATVDSCLFDDGESPLKEARNLTVTNTTFGWKYPLWYGKNHTVRNCTFLEMARSGLWYTDDSLFEDCHIIAPKEFRRCHNITLRHIVFDNAQETLWNCDGVSLEDVTAKGDYLCFNTDNVTVDNLKLNGNYCFDGSSNVNIRNSVLNSKDAFWNARHITIINCTIVGEYFGWNSEDVTLIGCHIQSHQGFCYMKGLKLVNCTISSDSDLIFEYCEDIDADITTSDIDSVKNPISGVIKADSVREIIRDDERIDTTKVRILVKEGESYHAV